jgi:hypothetical protein
MAISKVIDTPVKREERTDEAVIYAPMGQGYQVRVLRVTRDFYSDAPPVENARRWVARSMTQLLKDKAVLPLLAALPVIFDRWAQEDDLNALTLAELEAAIADAIQASDAAQAAMTDLEAQLSLADITLAEALAKPDLEARRIAQAEDDDLNARTAVARKAYGDATSHLLTLKTQLAAVAGR